jgi:hypothetical protein
LPKVGRHPCNAAERTTVSAVNDQMTSLDRAHIPSRGGIRPRRRAGTTGEGDRRTITG